MSPGVRMIFHQVRMQEWEAAVQPVDREPCSSGGIRTEEASGLLNSLCYQTSQSRDLGNSLAQ